MNTFERLESEVRSYCRSWPATFDKASGATLTSQEGDEYIDFFAGAGTLNYGHNPKALQKHLIDYLEGGGVTHSLDMMTVPKEQFLLTFEEIVLKPRNLDYKVMFPGPTGTNAVESALKLARKVTGRETVISFTNAFHGMTLGSLAVTGNSMKRAGAGVPLHHAVTMPYEGAIDDIDTLDQLEYYLAHDGSGVELPAAVIVETIQAEGGVNVASAEWMRRLRQLCREQGVLLIVDDIQAGCGRTGPFFSFEDMGLDSQPDIVCLSKSLSGYGLPFAVVLLDPRLDVWEPGEHNGTFRGFNLAFVTATAALREWWSNDDLTKEVARKETIVRDRLSALMQKHPGMFSDVRGRGLMQGIECHEPDAASAISAAAFSRGLVIETAGAESEVVKLLPSLTISDGELQQGLDILAIAAKEVAAGTPETDEVPAGAAAS